MSVNSAICTFHSVIKLGPDFVHLLLCHCMMYQKSVALCNNTKLDVICLTILFRAGIISCKCSYCSVSTVALVHV